MSRFDRDAWSFYAWLVAAIPVILILSFYPS
jgi:hypothetical protein